MTLSMGVWWGSDAAKALQVTAMHMAACMTAPACGDKTPTRFMVCCMATYVGTYLHRYAVVKVAQTEATILLRDGDAVQAHVAHGAPEVDVAREGIRLGKEPRCLRARRRRRRGPDHCKVNMGEGCLIRMHSCHGTRVVARQGQCGTRSISAARGASSAAANPRIVSRKSSSSAGDTGSDDTSAATAPYRRMPACRAYC